MTYPAPLLAERMDRKALDRMWGELKRAAKKNPPLPPPKPKPEPKPEPINDGRDKMSDYLRTSAIAYYCWMADEIEGGHK